MLRSYSIWLVRPASVSPGCNIISVQVLYSVSVRVLSLVFRLLPHSSGELSSEHIDGFIFTFRLFVLGYVCFMTLLTYLIKSWFFRGAFIEARHTIDRDIVHSRDRRLTRDFLRSMCAHKRFWLDWGACNGNKTIHDLFNWLQALLHISVLLEDTTYHVLVLLNVSEGRSPHNLNVSLLKKYFSPHAWNQLRESATRPIIELREWPQKGFVQSGAPFS